MHIDADAADGIAHGIHYATSHGTPQGSLGIAQLGLQEMQDDLSAPDDED